MPASRKENVEDIFADTEGAAAGQPVAQGKQRPARKNQAVPKRQQPSAPLPAQRKSTRTLMIILVAAAVVVIGGGAIIMASGGFQNSNAPSNVNTENVNTTPDSGDPGNQAPAANAAEPAPPAVDTATDDSDGDGLTDTEEKKRKTNIAAADTDADGLSDLDEVQVYKTDPLNSDSDGDGNADGVEVDGGYNPSGSGSLYDLMEEIKKLE